MIYAVWVPLLMPLLAAPAARRLAELLSPRQAVRLLTAAALTLGSCSAAALGLLVVAGALRLPPVAALGELIHPPADSGPATAVTAVAAALALAVCTAALVRTVLRQRAELREARRRHGGAGELAVVRDAAPDAYALPGRPGRIVVTTGMLDALAPAEREALFAHERAHLAGRHHLFIAAAELAALCHPALRALRAPLGYALERCADESAAGAVGDRSLAARAIGRAALAAHRAPAARPSVVLAATAGPVPRRVAALLGRHPTGRAGHGRRGRAARTVAAALLVCLSLSAAGALDAAKDLHGGIEAAQGGTGHH
ncbi:M56 family metallopeptidase [Streptomyces sp. NBC_01267]|uniref:M56 family metallopeptidase n=1 Tax=unclassified Streptomyces TaxID=2593676 RepID=UPI002025A05E|nr:MULTISPECIES: M56 family metallopeptidase [unclassified Streptomyces]MCX4553837.1 M56 family metallopeptidase [Streptomyces sp. NBC_01500]